MLIDGVAAGLRVLRLLRTDAPVGPEAVAGVAVDVVLDEPEFRVRGAEDTVGGGWILFPAAAAALTLFAVRSWVASLFLFFVLVEGGDGTSLGKDDGIGADGHMEEAAGLMVGLTGRERLNTAPCERGVTWRDGDEDRE